MRQQQPPQRGSSIEDYDVIVEYNETDEAGSSVGSSQSSAKSEYRDCVKTLGDRMARQCILYVN